MPDPVADPADIAAFRFGTGLPRVKGQPGDAAGILALLAGPDLAAQRWPAPAPSEILAQHAAILESRKTARRAEKDRAQDAKALRQAFNADLRVVIDTAEDYLRRHLARAVGSADAFRERLAAFWADHFTVAARTRWDMALVAAQAEEAVRPHVAGRFADLLPAAVLHPAMLIYLDQSASIGPGSALAKGGRGLNENLARELIELHTLGVGASYAQQDVRQMAELLTGVVYDPGKGQAFRPRQAEPGAETVLGQTYSGTGMAPVLQALDYLAHRPETAAHLARKLAVHFLGDTPDESLVARMAATYLAQDTALLPVYQVMLADPAAFAAPMRKARPPVEFIAAALRGLQVPPETILAWGRKPLDRLVAAPLTGMAQPWGKPRGPDGWPEETGAWITPQGLAARVAWGMDMPARLADPLPDPRGFAEGALGSLMSAALKTAVARSESRPEGVGLVLASPEFNRR